MRVANIENQFFRANEVQKDRIWLNLTNDLGVFSQTLIGYLEEGSQGMDSYDAKYINDSPIALTSNINNEEYTIQSRSIFATRIEFVKDMVELLLAFTKNPCPTWIVPFGEALLGVAVAPKEL